MVLSRIRNSQLHPALLLVDIRQLLTLRSDSSGSAPRRGTELSELGIIEDAAVLCLGGKIVSVGKTKDALLDPWLKKNRKKVIEIDCEGQVVVPGFVDSHTHPAFMNPRLVDFEKRTAGATYEEIANAGGGIRSSIEPVRKAGKGALAEKVLSALREMAEQGTTTVEAKSGYGLALDAELKSLAAIREAAAGWPGTVISTLLGAHVVPQEFRGRSQSVEIVCGDDSASRAAQAGQGFVDVSAIAAHFSTEETATIFACPRTSSDGRVGQLSLTPLERVAQFQPASLDPFYGMK
jgi:imidazolonepropionase